MTDGDLAAARRELVAASRAKEACDARFSRALERCTELGMDMQATLDVLDTERITADPARRSR